MKQVWCVAAFKQGKQMRNAAVKSLSHGVLSWVVVVALCGQHLQMDSQGSWALCLFLVDNERIT